MLHWRLDASYGLTTPNLSTFKFRENIRVFDSSDVVVKDASIEDVKTPPTRYGLGFSRGHAVPFKKILPFESLFRYRPGSHGSDRWLRVGVITGHSHRRQQSGRCSGLDFPGSSSPRRSHLPGTLSDQGHTTTRAYCLSGATGRHHLIIGAKPWRLFQSSFGLWENPRSDQLPSRTSVLCDSRRCGLSKGCPNSRHSSPHSIEISPPGKAPGILPGRTVLAASIRIR